MKPMSLFWERGVCGCPTHWPRAAVCDARPGGSAAPRSPGLCAALRVPGREGQSSHREGISSQNRGEAKAKTHVASCPGDKSPSKRRYRESERSRSRGTGHGGHRPRSGAALTEPPPGTAPHRTAPLRSPRGREATAVPAAEGHPMSTQESWMRAPPPVSRALPGPAPRTPTRAPSPPRTPTERPSAHPAPPHSPGSPQGAPSPAAERFSAAMVQRRELRRAVGGSGTHGPGRHPAPGGAERRRAGRGGGRGRTRLCRPGPVPPSQHLLPAPSLSRPQMCRPQMCVPPPTNAGGKLWGRRGGAQRHGAAANPRAAAPPSPKKKTRVRPLLSPDVLPPSPGRCAVGPPSAPQRGGQPCSTADSGHGEWRCGRRGRGGSARGQRRAAYGHGGAARKCLRGRGPKP